MDFLKSFVCDGGDGNGNGHCLKAEPLDEENVVELSLGLSLNGRFGVERRRMVANNNYDNNNSLIRSSSIAEFSCFQLATEDATPLTRTCSLPVETAVEWKKRKDLQSLRRSEAKRKRVEKLKNGKVVKEWLPPLPRPSLVSIGSPASGGSSGVSDLESQPFSGTNKDVESKSTSSHQFVSHKISSSIPYRSNSIVSERASEKFPSTSSQSIINGNNSKDEALKMMLADMPCVSTKGNGVNGTKIEGFLYRYIKGEEVRIVCVCHGNFLTPGEFVKHGGGGDVEHPLRHIVVNPPSL